MFCLSITYLVWQVVHSIARREPKEPVGTVILLHRHPDHLPFLPLSIIKPGHPLQPRFLSVVPSRPFTCTPSLPVVFSGNGSSTKNILFIVSPVQCSTLWHPTLDTHYAAVASSRPSWLPCVPQSAPSHRSEGPLSTSSVLPGPPCMQHIFFFRYLCSV